MSANSARSVNYPVSLVDNAGKIEFGTFILDEENEGEQCRLVLQFGDGVMAAEGSDYFESLCEIRLKLEKLGWRPVCFGSSRNVFPSGMCREMGRGLKAYRLQLGRQAKSTDLVGIIDSGPDVEPVSVQDQMQFFERWLKSLGANR